MSKAVLGCRYRDVVTGFEGVATGRCEYLTGCNQVLLAPRSEGGKPAEASWFDEQRLEGVVAEQIVLDNSASPGFDKPAPIR